MSDITTPAVFRVNPAFLRFPLESALVGFLLAAFGEIEFSVCANAGIAMGARQPVLRALYRLRATSSRLEAADALAFAPYAQVGLRDEYLTTKKMVYWCLSARNQFAHCNWGDDPTQRDAGLFFTDLQKWAAASEDIDYEWKHVDTLLLQEHRNYFEHTMESLTFLRHEIASRRANESGSPWPKPPALAQPPLHNSPALHLPPWLTEDQKALHLARAQAAKGGAPTPTPAQQAMEAGRARAAARRQADRDRGIAERSQRSPKG